MADCDVDPEQHERVAKALEQVNGLKYRECAKAHVLCTQLTVANGREMLLLS